jgi:NADH-quinone oxidoreductase subunit A
VIVAKLLGPRNPNPAKYEPYECGNVSIGDPWMRFHVGYYIFALLFVVFDIETVFLFPWAVVFRRAGLTALIELFLFVGIFVFGLFYAWKKGVLQWT